MPIGDVKTNTEGVITTINFGRYSFDAIYNSETQQVEGTGEPELKQSADNCTEVVEIDVGRAYNYIEKTSETIESFITKAKASGGYYIGRYEAGKVEGNTNTFNIKKGQDIYNSIIQADAEELAKKLYNGNNNFESDLINSYAWDTAIVFIQTFSGDTDYSKQTRLQGILTTTGNAHDEENNYDVRCNIYDMAGNVVEWDTEISTDSNHLDVVRGGAYFDTGYYTSIRHNPSASTSSLDIGFRSILYV